MAIFKGQVPFEIPNDEDDNSKIKDEKRLQPDKIHFYFSSDHPSMDEIESEVKRVKENLKKMSDEEIYNTAPAEVLYAMRKAIQEEFGLHPNKDGSDSLEDKKAIGKHIRNFINLQTPEDLFYEVTRPTDEREADMNKLTEELKEELFKAMNPFTQEDLDKLSFYDALVMDLFGPISDCGAIDCFPQHFYGEDCLGAHIKNIPGRPTLEVSAFDMSDKGDLWLYFYFDKKILYEDDLKLFLSNYCNGYNLLEKWNANIDDDGIVEFPLSEAHLLEETKTDPISELSNYVNIHYVLYKADLDDLDALLGMIKEDTEDKEFEVPHDNIKNSEVLQGFRDFSDIDVKNNYRSFPSDSEFYLRDPESFSCTGYIPTENILEKFIEKFGEKISLEDMIKHEIYFKGMHVDFSSFTEFKLIPQYTMKNRCVLGYLVSKQPTATGCYVAFYINEEGNFAAIIPPFGNAVDPKTGRPYDIRVNREYFTPDGVLKDFDIRAIQTQLEMVLYPIKKVRNNVFKYGTLLLTLDTNPDLENNRALIGRLRFNNQDITKEFKEKYGITSEYINIYYKPDIKVTNKKVFTYLSDYFFSLGKVFIESKLLENARLKRIDDKWFIDLNLSATIEFLNDVFSS